MPSIVSPTPAAATRPGHPDIAYAPSLEKYQARTAKRLESGNLPKLLPNDLPRELIGDLAWDGKTLAESYKWTYLLDSSQLDEIRDALSHFKGEPFSW